MPSKPKKQHFVPASYLRAFVDPTTPRGQTPYVWVFDVKGKRGKKKAPENLFKSTDMYTLTLPSGEKDYIVEESLARLESRYAQIFHTKIKNRLPLSEEEHVFLCAFVHAMIHRTKSFKRNIDNFVDQLLDRIESLEKQFKQRSKQGDELRATRNNIHSETLLTNLTELVSLIAQMSLSFLCAPTIGARFITSDNPCFLFNPDIQWDKFGGPGLAQKNVQVSLPLSPNTLLILSWSNVKGYVHASSKKVDDINRSIRGHADEFIVTNLPRTKLIWFSPLPLDFLFLLKFLRKKALYAWQAFRIRRRRRRWRMRKR